MADVRQYAYKKIKVLKMYFVKVVLFRKRYFRYILPMIIAITMMSLDITMCSIEEILFTLHFTLLFEFNVIF